MCAFVHGMLPIFPQNTVFGSIQKAMKRGGHKQRKLLIQDPVDPTSLSSHESLPDPGIHTPLFSLLVEKWAWGEISGHGIQEIAKAAYHSGCVAQDVVQVAATGAWGEQPGNIHRDLVRHLVTKSVAPEPFCIHTSVKQRNPDGSSSTSKHPIHILLPHEWIHAIDKHDMMESMCGMHFVEKFWSMQDVNGNPRFSPRSRSSISGLGFDPKVEKPIPFTVHGDGVPHTELDSLMVISMRAMTTSMSISHSQLLLCAIPKSCIVPDTMQTVWQIISWSLTCLAEGKFPLQDHNGHPFPTGSRQLKQAGLPLTTRSNKGLVYAITGDFEWFYQEFQFPRPNCNYPCPYCKADMWHKWDLMVACCLPY